LLSTAEPLPFNWRPLLSVTALLPATNSLLPFTLTQLLLTAALLPFNRRPLLFTPGALPATKVLLQATALV